MVRWVLPLMLWPLLSVAETGAMKEAQTHFRAGKAQYELGNYDAAIHEFAAGYALAPRPEFLINLAQAYRRAGDPVRAREMFVKYLEKAPPAAPERAQVEKMLAELEEQLAQQQPKPAPKLEPPVPVSEPALVAPPAAIATPPLAAMPPPPSAARHLAWALPLAAAVVAGAGVGIWAATRPRDPCASAGGLGCFDLRPR
jgi:tetratricopeptide (TPR) repeat protein